MIELKHLKTLQMLCNTGSMVAASTKLHLTQSALSHQMSEIEQRLGYKLFIRKSQPIQFTKQGEILLKLANTVITQVNQALTECKGATTRSLKMAIECHSCIQWLMPALKAFNQANPNVTIELESGIVFDLHPQLIQKQLDLLITSDTVSNAELSKQLVYTPLFDFEVRLILAPEHPLATKQTILPQDLQDQTLLTYPVPKQRLDIWQHFLSPANVNPKIKTVDNTSLLIQMVAAGMGVAALPHWAVEDVEKQQLIVTRPLGKGLWRHLYTANRGSHDTEPIIDNFIQSVRQHTQRSLRFTREIASN